MSEDLTKNETENDFGSIENVDITDLAAVEFPDVNKNAVEAAGGVNPPPSGVNTPPAGGGAPEGWNPDIHESPPRKNKSGGWAKKRGNKKGYVFGQRENANPPPLNVPPNAAEIAAEAERAAELEKKLAEQTRAAAEMAANGVILAANAFSGYAPEEVFRAAYVEAWERYFNSFGGVNLPPWVEVALMTGTIAVNAARREEAKPKLQRFREWVVAKIYAYRNRRKARKNQASNTVA